METLKLKTAELIAVRDEATQLLSKEKLSFLAKFQLSAVHGELVAKLEPFEKVRKELIEKFGTLNETKENYIIEEDNKQEFTQEMESILTAEIEFSFTPLDIALIGSIESENPYYQVFKLFKAA